MGLTRLALALLTLPLLSAAARAEDAGGSAEPAAGSAPPQGSPPQASPRSPQAQAAPRPPGTPPPQGTYPPQGYYPPPQGTYPPPQGTYPPQGYYYPPQGYYPGYPPPQGYPPPPGYGPQGTLRSPAPIAPPPPLRRPRAFLPIVFLGIHTLLGEAGQGFSPGPRVGTILGGRLNPRFSINGELTLDILNRSADTPGFDVWAFAADLALSPFVHFTRGNAELVIGPKLGLRGLATRTSGGEDAGNVTASGFVFGANAGVFGALTPRTSIGVLLSFVARSYTVACTQVPRFSESCTAKGLPDLDKVVGLTGALMF